MASSLSVLLAGLALMILSKSALELGISPDECAPLSVAAARAWMALFNLALAGVLGLGIWAVLRKRRGGRGAWQLGGQILLAAVAFGALYVLAGGTSC